MNSEFEVRVLERLDRIEKSVREIRELVGPFGVSFPESEILVQTLHGTKYLIDANDLVMTPQLVVYRQWESDLSAFFIKSATADMVFLDVGANFGYFSCLVGSRIGVSGRGRVIAVEPNPRMFDLLSRNIKINWSMAPIEAHECAITLGGKSTDMVIPVNGAANASIFNVQACQVNGPYARMHVRGSTVDEIVAGRRVDLIKIDVEGYELHVFEGSTETFINSPNVHVVMEWSLAQMGAAKIDPNAVLDKIEKFGLNVYRLPESIHVPSGTLDSLRIKRHDLVSIPYANVYMRKHQ